MLEAEILTTTPDPHRELLPEQRVCMGVIALAVEDLQEGPPPPGEVERLRRRLKIAGSRREQQRLSAQIKKAQDRRSGFRSARRFLLAEPSNLDWMAAGIGIDADLIRDRAREIVRSASR